MANNVGDVKSIKGTSMALNGQRGDGASKPNMGNGKDSPGGTKPMRVESGGRAPLSGK
jgi:hypothetical protein